LPQDSGARRAIDVVISVDADAPTIANRFEKALGRLGNAGELIGRV
jgi:hypothetical protein